MEEIVVEALGEEGFALLIAAFYRRVRNDDLVGGMYPQDDWEGAEDRLRQFMEFRFGISQRYILERGHPRLRMRHMPFRIGEAERDRWLEMMNEAMDEVELRGEPRELLSAFFAQVADFMRNQAPSGDEGVS
ncbi:MAG: globin [Verrucomicrobiota bacterium]